LPGGAPPLDLGGLVGGFRGGAPPLYLGGLD